MLRCVLDPSSNIDTRAIGDALGLDKLQVRGSDAETARRELLDDVKKTAKF